MKTQTLIVTLGLVSFGLAAWSHSGATGIVKERMDGMSAMSRVIKDLTPMMRGNVDYDAQQVRDAADVMISHAGDQMTSLFPEGTGAKPSAALPAVWEDWDEFAALAEELKEYATGLKIAAANGLGDNSSNNSASSMMGGDTTTMMGGDAMGSSSEMTAEMFETMPANMAFNEVAQTCSVCHQKFRVKEN